MTAPRIAARQLVNAEHESARTKVIMRYAAQRALMLAAIVALAACGDSSGPDKYPDMLGSYDITATFPPKSGVSTGSGTINITGQQDSTLTGDATVVAEGLTLTGFSFGAVQKNGYIRFTLGPYDPDHPWFFSGHTKGSTMSGSETLDWPTGTASGSWTATRR